MEVEEQNDWNILRFLFFLLKNDKMYREKKCQYFTHSITVRTERQSMLGTNQIYKLQDKQEKTEITEEEKMNTQCCLVRAPFKCVILLHLYLLQYVMHLF